MSAAAEGRIQVHAAGFDVERGNRFNQQYRRMPRPNFLLFGQTTELRDLRDPLQRERFKFGGQVGGEILAPQPFVTPFIPSRFIP